MAVKRYKIGVYEDDGIEYNVANELSLIEGIRGIKFAGFQQYYVELDEILQIQDKQSYVVARTFYLNGELELTGAIGVL